MYQSFFGFKALPFKITPDERVFFAGAHRQEMLDALLYGIERGEGIITVVGEVGIGKTTLARVLSNRFSHNFSIISIFTPNVSALDMLRLIAQEAGLSPSTASGKVELMQLIRAYCMQLHQQGKRFLLLIDEAQTMWTETIEELRLLSNMQVDDVKLVQVLLFGQPELDRMLNSPELRQVKDRVVFQIHIEPLSRDELADYLEFRIQQAGFYGQHFFNVSVVDAIFRKTQGYPRAVNRLADQALMAAFAEQTRQVLVEHVESSNQEAIQPLAVSEATQNASDVSFSIWRSRRTRLVALLAICVVSAIGVWWLNNDQSSFIQHEANASTAAVVQQVTTELPAVLPQSPKIESIAPVSNQSQAGSTPVPSVAPVEIEANTSAVVSQPASSSVLKTAQSDEEWRQLHQTQLTLFQHYAEQDKYAIQLMSSPWRLRNSFMTEMAELVRQLPSAPAFYYDYSMTADRPRIAGIYGVYASKAEAKQALNSLTLMNKGYRPDMISYKQVVALMSTSQVLAINP